jgi:PAS domain S-box-containing protein
MVNDEICRMLDRSRDELVGRSARVLYPTDAEYEYVGREKYRQISERGTGTVETCWQARDGRILDVLLSSTPLDPDDWSVGVTFTALDITQRVAAERERNRLAAIVEATSDFVSTADLDGNILYVNPAGSRLLGWDPTPRTLPRITDVHPPWATEVVIGVGLPVAERDGYWQGETALVDRHGREIPVSQVIIAHRSPGGQLLHYSTIIRDLRELKAAQLELEQRTRLVETVLDSLPVGILVAETGSGAASYVNRRFEEITGLAEGELLDVSAYLERVMPDPQLRGRATEQIGRELASQHAEVLRWEDLHIPSPSGEDRYLTAECVLLPAQALAIHILEDVTGIHSLEEQYRQAQKMEAIGRLAGGVAHDFNNLLTAIQGHSDLLLADLPTHDRRRRSVEAILAAAARGGGLTRQLLAFSRKQILTPRVVCLNEVVTETVRLLERLIGEDVQVETALEGDLGLVEVDPGQLSQALINLAINARDAMPRGGTLAIATADVNLTEDEARQQPGVCPGEWVRLEVRDTGTGMGYDVLQHLFEPFFTTKERGKGTGLGLSMVYGTVTQSGGHIQVHSEPGRGSTFVLSFPRVPVRPDVNTSGQATVEPARSPSETVLLVEDADEVRNLLERMLEFHGYRVVVADSAEAAMVIAERFEGTIDLLLTDVVMPGINGRELAHRLARQRPGLRTLFISGYTDSAIVHDEVVNAGLSFLQKPFSSGDLARTVRQVLDGR